MKFEIRASGFRRIRSQKSLKNFIRSKAENTGAQAWGSPSQNGWSKNTVETSGPSPGSGKGLLSILPFTHMRRTKMGMPSVPSDAKGKVLVIDDAPDTLEIIRKLLQYEGYEVVVSL